MRLIDADSLVEELFDKIYKSSDSKEIVRLSYVSDVVKKYPTISTETLKNDYKEHANSRYGNWIAKDGEYYCNVCSYKSAYPSPYCPICGMKMERDLFGNIKTI